VVFPRAKPQYRVSGVGTSPDDDGHFHNKNRICDVKMHIKVIFFLNLVRTHNTTSRAKIDLLKRCVLKKGESMYIRTVSCSVCSILYTK